MPFDVMVVNGSVRVLGTEFEVQARASSSDVGSGRATVVQVVEGRVLVRGKVAQPAVILEAGEISTIPADGTAPSAASPVTVDRIAVWREGGFAAVDATLSGILQDLQAHYGVEMALRNGAVAGRRLTLYYPNRVSARTIIADICTSQGLSFRPTKRGFELE
jgi:ferric-dicitrate binding protein FerR (iron transport regulator)